MWPEVLFSLLLLGFSASLSWFLRRKWKLGLFRRHGIPGPEPEFFWGNYMQLKEDRIQVMERWIAEYGKVFGYYSGEVPFIVVSEPDMVKECLVKEFPTFHDRPPFVLCVEPFSSCMLQLTGTYHFTILFHNGQSAKKQRLCEAECVSLTGFKNERLLLQPILLACR
ncbi:hypothetical protein HPB51_013190 [Rhipicephalus microplus]|uniref:Cytochrome n=1 Tax=Rhipicephalus microplus TaxID=6941 RepID=A0A9J6EHH4_RHIMP|nr:hypothetical protein HPB51_013190 [Rhipicephalus microplus]